MTTLGWTMQSSGCLGRYWLSIVYLMLDGPDHTRLNHAVKWLWFWLSTAYLMLGGPDHTRLNHPVKWLFDKVLAVNCMFDVRWIFKHPRLKHSVMWLFEKVLAVNCMFDVRWIWPHQAESRSKKHGPFVVGPLVAWSCFQWLRHWFPLVCA